MNLETLNKIFKMFLLPHEMSVLMLISTGSLKKERCLKLKFKEKFRYDIFRNLIDKSKIQKNINVKHSYSNKFDYIIEIYAKASGV